jgi:hypothetical protein
MQTHNKRASRKHRESQMTKIETVTKPEAAERNVGLLRDEELDTVVGGGKARPQEETYLKLELKTVYVSSV